MFLYLFALVCVAFAREWTFNGLKHVGKITSKNPGICDPNVQQWAGTYQISSATHKNYFYWAFASRKDPENAPTVLWMTGGPGCSSELALLAENGPCKIDGNLQTTLNPYSWNSIANLVYVDQPADVGFSYSDATGMDHNETEVAEDMYHFLQDLFQEHQNWLKNDFYIIGESYGGHYVPATAHRVYQGNVRNESVYLPLKGAGVGNGLTNPQIQYQYYGQFAYNYSIERLGHPVVTLDAYKKMQAALPFCLSELKKCSPTTPLACEIAYEYCNSAIVSVYSNTGLNPYDFRKPCGSDPLCYDFTNITTWLNLQSTQQALGVKPTKWQTCNMQVNQKFATDYMQGFEGQLPDLLNNGIKVMIYVGDCGFICNWIGNKQWTLALPWKGQSGFVSSPDVAWSPKGKEVALSRTYGGFTFLQVHDAGHMVPMDQPEVALQILDTFLNSHW